MTTEINNTIATGVAVASSSVLAEITILTDTGFLYLAGVGAIVSAFGVVHELSTSEEDLTTKIVIGSLVKGLVIGLFSIPFWYLILSKVGNEFVIKYFEVTQQDYRLDKSIWFIIAFYLSWYSVPVFDFLVKRVKKVFGGGENVK